MTYRFAVEGESTMPMLFMAVVTYIVLELFGGHTRTVASWEVKGGDKPKKAKKKAKNAVSCAPRVDMRTREGRMLKAKQARLRAKQN